MYKRQGEGCRITVAPKGFGSENMSQIKMLKPADGVEMCIRDRVYADPDRLRQVFINIMDNAIKYSAPGGRITVKPVSYTHLDVYKRQAR